MSLAARKLYVKKSGAAAIGINLYTTLGEVRSPNICISTGGIKCYAKCGEVSDPYATPLRVTDKYNNPYAVLYEAGVVKWGNPTPLSVKRVGHGHGSIGNYALFLGGYQVEYQNGSVTASVDVYNSNLVRISPVEMPVKIRKLNTTNVGGYLLCVGGVNENSSCIGNVFAYNESLVRSNAAGMGIGESSVSNYNVNTIATAGNYAIIPTEKRVIAYNNLLVQSTVDTSVLKKICGASGKHALFAVGEDTTDVNYFSALLTRGVTSLLAGKTSAVGVYNGKYSVIAGGSDGTVNAYDTNLTRINPAELRTSTHQQPAMALKEYFLFTDGGNKKIEVYDKNLIKCAQPNPLSIKRWGVTGASVGNYALFAGGGSGSDAVDAYTIA